jgi:hypothetical protein
LLAKLFMWGGVHFTRAKNAKYLSKVMQISVYLSQSTTQCVKV